MGLVRGSDYSTELLETEVERLNSGFERNLPTTSKEFSRPGKDWGNLYFKKGRLQNFNILERV